MQIPLQRLTSAFYVSPATATLAAALLCAFTFLGSQPAQAQNFTVIHSFAGSEGANPNAGVTIDRAGNLYGTTKFGGENDYGAVYNLTPFGSGWILHPLYSFRGNDADGANPSWSDPPNPNRWSASDGNSACSVPQQCYSFSLPVSFISCASSASITWERTASRSETGLLIPSVIASFPTFA